MFGQIGAKQIVVVIYGAYSPEGIRLASLSQHRSVCIRWRKMLDPKIHNSKVLTLGYSKII